MKIEVNHYIEVTGVENIWAVELHKCKPEMKPDIPNFIFVHNDISNEGIIYVDNTISELKPEKIIDGVNGGISDDYIEVGFWRIKNYFK